MNIFTQFFKKNGSMSAPRTLSQDLMRKESEISRDIFGPIQPGGKRDFFCLDAHTWIWYEEWTHITGERKQLTTRYLIRETEIVKSQNGGAYHRLTIPEAKNFQAAADEYIKRAKEQIYVPARQARA
mgnify:CR=1 FL=1